MAFYHAHLPVYTWMSGPDTGNMYQFEEHTVWIGTTSRCSKKVYPSLLLFFKPLSARGLAHCSTSHVCFFPSHLQLPNYLAYSAGRVEQIQNKNLGGFMSLIHVLWYLDKFMVGCRNIDALVVVDETPAMATEIAMSDTRTKVLFLVVSVIRQKHLSSAVGGALQHAMVMRYMSDNDQMEDGVTCAHWDTQQNSHLRAFRSRFGIAIDVTKGTTRCMWQKPPKNRVRNRFYQLIGKTGYRQLIGGHFQVS